MIAPASAARQVADWGFLAEPDLPDRPGPAYLLVAIRDQPTLQHFDPESVEYWVSADGRGARAILDRTTCLPIETDFSWGLIRITDRLAVTNEYVTFGGRLTAAEVDGVTVAAFTSPVPLLRRGGHSQGWDHGAFVRDLGARYRQAPALREAHPELWAMLRSEALRLERDQPAAWAAGAALAASLARD